MRKSTLLHGKYNEIMNELALADCERQEQTHDFPAFSYNWVDPVTGGWREEWPLVKEWVAERERRSNAPYDAYYRDLKYALDHVRPATSFVIADQLIKILEAMHHGEQIVLHGEILNRFWQANHAVVRSELVTRRGTVPLG